MASLQQRTTRYSFPRIVSNLTAVSLAAMLLAGCGLFGGAQESPTPMPTRTPFPTFTPTSVADAPTATLPVVDTQPLTSAVTGMQAVTQTVTISEGAQAAAPAPAATATPVPAMLTIASDLVNVRSGPGTAYDLVGSAANGESFTIVAKTAAGDWWQICCVGGQNGWVFGELATVQHADDVVAAAIPAAAPLAEDVPTQVPADAVPLDAAPPESVPVEAPVVEAAPVEAPVAAAPYDPSASSAGNFDPNAQYQIVHFKVLGLEENNGGIRDSGAQHHIFVTVLDQNGNGVDGAVVRNLVGDKSEVTTGNKGPGKTEITMFYEPFKLVVVSDPSGPVTSQVSNQMGLIFPHLPDIVGKLGDVNYEYGACPTIDIKCEWPLSALHFSYEITFQRVQ